LSEKDVHISQLKGYELSHIHANCHNEFWGCNWCG
jgi:hypothetical protein